MSPPTFSAWMQPSWKARWCIGKMSLVTFRPDRWWVYSYSPPKNFRYGMPTWSSNRFSRSGRMLRMVVFIGWSPDPASMPHHRISISAIHWASSTPPPGCMVK